MLDMIAWATTLLTALFVTAAAYELVVREQPFLLPIWPLVWMGQSKHLNNPQIAKTLTRHFAIKAFPPLSRTKHKKSLSQANSRAKL